MKKQKICKLFLSVLLTIALLGSKANLIFAMEVDVSPIVTIPEDVYQYAKSNYLSGIQVFDTYDEKLNINESELESYTLGNPFIIYNLDEEQQQKEIYYFPIFDSNKQVVLVFSVIGTNIGWTHCISQEMVDALNGMNYPKSSNYIIYKSGDNLVAESEKNLHVMSGRVDSNINKFSSIGFEEKKEIVSEVEDNFVKTDVTSPTAEFNGLIKDKYSPSLSVATNASAICSLYNNKGQSSYGACWAASVATITNYRKERI